MESIPYGLLAALVGLAGGLVLGLAARLGDFCTLGALEHAAYGGNATRLRLWGVVLGTAILATQGAAGLGLINLSATFYHSITWLPAASIIGGLMFGYGMAMAGNCGFGALVRFGGGDLRSMVVVVVMAIASFVALSGPLGPLRALAFPQTPSGEVHTIATDLAALTGLPAGLIVLGLGLALLGWGLSSTGLRARPAQIGWGVAAGLAVTGCLAGTSLVAHMHFGAVPVEGPSFTAPLGRTLIFLMTSTAGGITFSVGLVVGVMAGAFIGSFRRGRFRWEACEDPRELGRQVGGAVLMGFGGVIAMGCSVGQGVTAMATLAWSAPVTLMAIAAGALLGLKHLIVGYQAD